MIETDKLVLPNIKLAREITEQFLKYDDPILNKDAFYMFSISKFILLKEKIIKKDSVNSILYFDNIKNKEYIPIIMYFYQELLKNGSYKRNKTSVVLKDETLNIKNLKDAIWCINKIRDALAHGKYVIDTKRDCISINNVAQDNSYSLEFDIPIELLNSFTLIVGKNDSIIDDKYLVEPTDYVEDKKADYINRFSKYIFNYNKYKDNLINNDLKNFYYDNNINKKIYIDKSIYKNDTNYIIPDIYDNSIDPSIYYLLNHNLDKLSLEELYRYARILLTVKPKDEDKISYVKLIKEYKKLLDLYNENQRDSEFSKKTRKLIDEMKKIIGIKDKQINSSAITSLYNYMSIVFSQIKDIDYSKIKTESLLIDFAPKGKIEGTAINYNNTIDAIKKKCEEFNNMMESHIENYDNNQNQRYRHSLMDSFVRFYIETLESMGRRNKFIIDSVRNSIEHANYNYYDKGYIVLHDQTDHNDNNTIKFIAASKPFQMFELTKQIENSKNNEYLLSDFVKQLTTILDNDTFERTWNNMNRLSMIIFGKELDLSYSMENMYQEALLTVMNQVKLKQ